MGSSPRMRGSQEGFTLSDFKKGIIPAHAGLTCFGFFSSGGFWDHPRACGAHKRWSSLSTSCRGSSPRMRGSLLSATPRSTAIGIIPAHAGLTSWASCSWTWKRDHPRACGAHILKMAAEKSRLGSSPRMRGSPDS